MSTQEFWTRLYRGSLRVLPRELRAKHGASMELMFVRDLERARTEGQGSAVGVALAAMWDLVSRGSYERVRGGRRADSSMLVNGSTRPFAYVPAPRVLLRQLISTYLVTLATFTIGLLAFTISPLFQAGKYSGVQIVELIALSVPFVAAATIPLSVFLAVLQVMLRVTKAPASVDNEPPRNVWLALLLPTLLFAAGIAVANFGLATEVVPRANARYEDVRIGKPAAHGDRSMTLAQLESRHSELEGQLLRRRETAKKENASVNAGPYENEMRVDRLAYMAAEVRDAQVLVASNAVEIHKKYSLSIACVVMALIAVTIAMLRPNGGTGLVVGSSLVVYGAYYVCLMSGEAMADALVVTPFLGMWGVNFVMLALALPMLWIRRQAMMGRPN